MIYNSFFGLNEEPFGVTPDPKFLFISRKHEEAIASIDYGITHRRGFIMLTGEVGSGKTTVIRHIFERLEPSVQTALVMNPRMNAFELLKVINHDFGIPARRNATHKTLMDDLNGFLLECRRSGGTAVLAIDEAHEMSTECLEFVRLLSNLETDTKKLIQIILVGQPELRDIVGSKRLKQLEQRIAVRYHLEPLDLEETRRYIRHRLEVAGSGTIIFPEKGLKAIHRFSRGIPRLINLCCDRILLASYANEELRIRTGHIKEVLREFKKEEVAMTEKEGRKEKKEGRKEKIFIDLKPALGGLVLLALIGLFTYGGLEQREVSVTASSVADTTGDAAQAGEQAAAIFTEDGLYMATAVSLSEDASLLNLLGIWGEEDLDKGPVKEYLKAGGYSVYSFKDMEKITRFNMPVVLELDDGGSGRHVTLKSVVGEYALILDPLQGKQIVPFGDLKEKAVMAQLVYKNGNETRSHGGKTDEKALILLSRGADVPTLSP